MTYLNNHGRILVTNLIILIIGLFYVEETFSLHINKNLNRNLLDDNHNDDNNSQLIYNNNHNINVQFQQQENNETKELYPVENNITLPFKSRTGYLVVIISSYLALYLNFVGTSYVLYRSFYKWKNSGISLPMTLRVPMYIAITDFFLIITYIVNISHMAMTQTIWEDSSCKIIGGLTFFFQCMNIFLVGGVAVT